MSRFAGHVQAAVLARLASAGLGWPVFTVAPDEADLPYHVLEDGAASDLGGKNTIIEQHQLIIRSFDDGTSKVPLLAEVAKITVALDRQPMMAAGARLTHGEVRGGADARDIETGLLLAETTVVVRARPPLD